MLHTNLVAGLSLHNIFCCRHRTGTSALTLEVAISHWNCCHIPASRHRYSCTKKIIVMLELTAAVPLEDLSHLAHERKTSKYASFARTCEENGFTSHFFALEVGCLVSLPPQFPDLPRGPWSTKVLGTQNQDRMHTRGTKMFLPPLSLERHFQLVSARATIGVS